MDTEAFLKYDQPSFDHNDFLYNPEEEDFSFPPKTILENLDSLPSNINQHQNNNHTNSFISTNCSFKNTPEHEILSVDSLNNDRRLNAIPKVRKNIYKKYYEPIFDNQLIYRYEDDPVEYRKARKRVQNRESACRVRGRKKTQVEQIEDEVKDLKRKNEELMLCNASLAAENNLLKQQISFLQKLAIKSSKSDPFVIENADINSRYLLPVKNSEDEKVRISNQTSASKHFTILGILTILLFIFSNTLGENTKATISFSEQFRNQFDRSLKSLNGSLGSQEEEMKVSVYLGQTFDFLLEQYQTLRTMYSCIKYSIILLYAGYFIWIVYYFLIKKYVKLKIKKI